MRKEIIKQKIWTSKGCPYRCEFCYNGDDLKVLDIPEITENNVQIQDPAFLSIPNVIDRIKELGSKKVNGKVVYYELTQGINYKDLNQDIANALKENRFIKIRFAWDRKYNRHYMFKVYDCKNIFIKAGYKSKDLMCYILTNWLVPEQECYSKLDLFKIWNIKVGDCCYNGGYHIKNYIDYMTNQTPKNWSYDSLKKWRRSCRKHNQILRGIDPELK